MEALLSALDREMVARHIFVQPHEYIILWNKERVTDDVIRRFPTGGVNLEVSLFRDCKAFRS